MATFQHLTETEEKTRQDAMKATEMSTETKQVRASASDREELRENGYTYHYEDSQHVWRDSSDTIVGKHTYLGMATAQAYAVWQNLEADRLKQQAINQYFEAFGQVSAIETKAPIDDSAWLNEQAKYELIIEQKSRIAELTAQVAKQSNMLDAVIAENTRNRIALHEIANNAWTADRMRRVALEAYKAPMQENASMEEIYCSNCAEEIKEESRLYHGLSNSYRLCQHCKEELEQGND